MADKEKDELCLAIGEFIYEFSQLEFTMRDLLGSLLELEGERFDIVTSPYDFTTLCTVAHNCLIRLSDCSDKLKAHSEKTFNDCKGLNTDRVRIAHGAWIEGGGARHVSRQTLKASTYFLTPQEIRQKTAEAQRLMTAIVNILIGDPEDWPDILKRLHDN